MNLKTLSSNRPVQIRMLHMSLTHSVYVHRIPLNVLSLNYYVHHTPHVLTVTDSTSRIMSRKVSRRWGSACTLATRLELEGYRLTIFVNYSRRSWSGHIHIYVAALMSRQFCCASQLRAASPSRHYLHPPYVRPT